jgi:S1-C subfamily serine protease
MSQKAVYQLSARQILLIAVISALFAAGTVACLNQFGNRMQITSNAENEPENKTYTEAPLPGITDPQTVSDEQNNIEVYKTISPGVALITTGSGSGDGLFGSMEEERSGSGSGSVIDANGHILTNNHVVEGSSKVTVSLGANKTYPAKVVGADPNTDLAVIKIEAPKEALTVVPFGDSDNLQVGQKVLAIGNPFGFDRTLTTGVISGLQRPIRARNGRPIEGAIQTDASINPGNSGGPLLDSRGRMIGINSQILSPSGGSVGVGFAVPVSIAKRIVPQLIQFGEVRRPGLGVSTISVERLKYQMDLPVQEGLLIVRLSPGGSAEKAGLRTTKEAPDGSITLGDIITAIDGEKISDQDDLYKALDKKSIGDTIQVEVYRTNSKITVPVKLFALPNQNNRPTGQPPRRF